MQERCSYVRRKIRKNFVEQNLPTSRVSIGRIHSVSLLPTNVTICEISCDRMVQLGDSFEQYQLSAELIGHSKDVRCVAEVLSSSCPSGDGLVSGSRDNSAKVWLRSKLVNINK